MCGIAGIFDTRGRRAVSERLLQRMGEVQHHRGPDGSGRHIEPGLGLGHQRLAIIDLTSGQQPLANEDGSVIVVFNGEIYNFRSLCRELTLLGHRFRTVSDTEVIVHAWEQWGEECVQRFRGMFAFALWDRNRETLFLARDRLGIKPLYYAWLPDRQLIFSSELKALLRHPQLVRGIDPRALEDYLAFGYVPEPKTILRNVWKLPPGHTLTVARADQAPPRVRRYWDVPFRAHADMIEAEATEEFRRQLCESVRLHLVADVPLGAFLSGGVDSSAVVAMMAGLVDTPIKTCSIAFADAGFDESGYAGEVAARYGTDHRVEQIAAHDLVAPAWVAAVYDEPFADSSAIPTYRLCCLARRNVTVALSGDGGDENLAGYRRHRWHMHEERMRGLMPALVRRPLFGLLGHAYPKLDWAPQPLRAKTTFQAIARDTLEGYMHGVSRMSENQRSRLYTPVLRRELQGYRAIEVVRAHAANAPVDHPLSLAQYLDMKTYLVGDILTKVDRASMAHSLEVRVPLLDHVLVEWISGLAPELKLRGGEGKYILKKAFEPYVSRRILYRPKQGFSVPLAAWMRGPLRARLRQMVIGPTLRDCGFFNVRSLERMIEQHLSGRSDHSTALWSLMMLESSMARLLH